MIMYKVVNRITGKTIKETPDLSRAVFNAKLVEGLKDHDPVIHTTEVPDPLPDPFTTREDTNGTFSVIIPQYNETLISNLSQSLAEHFTDLLMIALPGTIHEAQTFINLLLTE